MKKSRDILGEIVKGIVAVGIVGSVVSAIGGIASKDITSGLISLGALISCLFVYWLVSAISKISTNLNDIKHNSDVIRTYCEQHIQNPDNGTAIPTPTNSENKV